MEAHVYFYMTQEIMEWVYSNTLKRNEEQLHQFIQKNSLLQRNAQVCFRYKGVIYGRENYFKRGLSLPRPINQLHSNLLSGFKEFLHVNGPVIKAEKTNIRNYLANVMTQARTLTNLLKVLPESLHPILRNRASELPTESKLSEKQLQDLIESNDKYKKLLQKRLLLNMVQG